MKLKRYKSESVILSEMENFLRYNSIFNVSDCIIQFKKTSIYLSIYLSIKFSWRRQTIPTLPFVKWQISGSESKSIFVS